MSVPKTIPINRFDGIAQDYLNGQPGEFSLAKQFDTISYPWRLQPLRGMTTETTTDSKIGNIIQAGGRLYGVGTDPSNPTQGKLWVRSDTATTSAGASFGGSSTWRSLTSNQLSGGTMRGFISGYSNGGTDPYDYAFLVEHPDSGNVRTLFWASTNMLVTSDPLGGSSAATDTLTFSTISQGFVHPKDKLLYFGYQTGTGATWIGYIGSNAAAFTTKNYVALQLPSKYRVMSLTAYGNYLAIGVTTGTGSADIYNSAIFLWDRDTSITTVSEIIPLGSGKLSTLNNYFGQIIALLQTDTNTFTGSVQDSTGLQIRSYSGGSEATILKEIILQHNIGSGTPLCLLNMNVNFISRNKLYFSANLVPGDGTTARYGLWCIGMSKTGRFVVTMERMETNTNTGVGIIAAAIVGDFVSMAHTDIGTLTYSTNGATSTTSYAATSVYESVVNPDMPDIDYARKKQLMQVYVNYYPLVSGQSVVLKYRVNSLTNGAWTTVYTDTTVGSSQISTSFTGTEFTAGQKYEFRIESVGGVVISDWGYKYNTITTEY